jgi:hypothetical protein
VRKAGLLFRLGLHKMEITGHLEVKVIWPRIIQLVYTLVNGIRASSTWATNWLYTIAPDLFIKLDNARSASNDEYLKILHNRIRELEETCAKGGVTVPPGHKLALYHRT